MRRILSAFVLAALVALGCQVGASAEQISPQLAQVLSATYLLSQEGFTCTATAFQTSTTGTYLVTARHCVVSAEAVPGVPGKPAVPGKNGKPGTPAVAAIPAQPIQVYTDETVQQGMTGTPTSIKTISEGQLRTQDWAVVFAPALQSVTVVPLGPNAGYTYGTPIALGGYPYGIGPILSSGQVSSLPISVPEDTGPELLFAIWVLGAPGNSGSAVVDLNTMTIIGILVQGLSDGQGGPAVIAATPIEEVLAP